MHIFSYHTLDLKKKHGLYCKYDQYWLTTNLVKQRNLKKKIGKF